MRRRPPRYFILFAFSYVFLLCHWGAGTLTAQPFSVSGRVTDAESGASLPGANVFLASTTLGAATDSAGAYAIHQIPEGAYTLVVSMIGYEAARKHIELAWDGDPGPHDFELHPQAYVLDPVEVTAEEDRAWQRRYERFEAQFLGTWQNAGQAVILNPEVLEFEESRGGVLTARAFEPLRIENRSLGYLLTYVLSYFEHDPQAEILHFRGEVFFQEMAPADSAQRTQWEARREATYLGSEPHLFASIIDETTFEEGFLIYDSRQNNLVGSRGITSEFTGRNKKELAFRNPLLVVYSRKTGGDGFFNQGIQEERSLIQLVADSVVIERDGYFSPAGALVVSGSLSERRVSDLLPRHYGAVKKHHAALPSPPSRAYLDRFLPGDPFIEVETLEGNPSDLDSTSIDARILQAREAMAKERWGRAGRLLGEIVEEDPDHMRARYLQAIRYREKAKVAAYVDPEYIPNKIDSDWERAIDTFEWVLERDSSYADVLYQYALLWRYAPRFSEAVRLAERQVELRPELPHVHVGLFRIYQAYINNRSEKRSLKRLARHESPYALYAQAEVLRRLDRWDEAEELLHDLLDRQELFSNQPVLLSLARLYYDRGDPDAAEPFVWRAIGTLRSYSDARFLFEDIKYILTPQEWATYQDLEAPEDFRRFFTTFWEKRDPIPADRINQRMTEHYRRLREAERYFVIAVQRNRLNNPDKLGELPVPEHVSLNESFNDMGLIYIRHGEPDEKIVTLFEDPILKSAGVAAGNVPFNESWRYENPRMDFHFAMEGGGANWRLRSGVDTSSAHILAARESWGGVYTDLAQCAYRQLTLVRCSLAEWIALDEELKRESREHVQIGLRADRHTWSDSIEHFDFPFILAAFKGDNEQTVLELYYALPVNEFADYAEEKKQLAVELGCTLHDLEWNRVDGGLSKQRVRADYDAPYLLGSCRFAALPGRYHLSLHSRILDTPLVGAYKLDQELPDYDVGRLALSDVVPATSIVRASRPSRFNRGDVHMKPNPLLRFSRTEPVHLYYEVYHLSNDAAGRSSYDVTYALTRKPNRGLFGRRNDEVVLSVTSTQTGSGASSVETPEIDVSNVDPGDYVLTVTVTDAATGESVQRSLEIEIDA